MERRLGLGAFQEGRWTAAVDGKTCRQGLDAHGSPVQMLSVFLQRVKLGLDQWSIGNDKTNEPGSLKVHLAELLAAYPALQLLSGDAIHAQRPLLDLFQVKANPPTFLMLWKPASFKWQVEHCLDFVADRWWDEARHYTKRPGMGEAFALLINAARVLLRLIHPPGEPLRATAERVQWRHGASRRPLRAEMPKGRSPRKLNRCLTVPNSGLPRTVASDLPISYPGLERPAAWYLSELALVSRYDITRKL